ncbi:uncharacterized protein A1O9_08630 [Exophiala aquamarina CBS 119918]|uniref:Dienelactone hydrolase domain-containing protein n=1 Tax=Exophiala aquamarina CBS 119918 TaxID=1182545 RepID=A0A072P6Q4_9EURO|nr:uncharacterized protein A1O9_08630 [Exophiala aquamarina CBS 119918]KEF54978.1 hypothetical protein A1O9_08630 [Exophiala aquamarina CBS 119918]
MSCPNCFSGSEHTHGTPQGTIETVHGIRTYTAGIDSTSNDETPESKSAIIYLPDAFGLKLVNNLLLADAYAARTGCLVLIPDVVYGGGISPHVLPLMEVLLEPAPSWSVTSVFWKTVNALRALPYIVPFLLFGHPKNTFPQVLDYARAVRAELPAGGKLGVAGFCWGAWGATKLCAENATADGAGERLIDAQFNAHPSFIIDTPEMVVDAITRFRVPYASAVAELDFQFNAAAAERTEAKVREAAANSTGMGAGTGNGASGDGDGDNGLIYEFKIYKGCKHGFGVRAVQDTVNMDGYRDALEQAVAWFNKYLN